MADLVLKGIRKGFGEIEILHGIDLTVKDGEFCVFVGPSGCGKSTLLRVIAGLEEATSGEIRIDGQDVTDLAPAKRSIAMVFQSYALYPHMSVYDNMAFGLKLAGYKRAEIDERVGKAASILQINPLLKRKPRELSGGQRQRVAIGRAIVREPKIFLFDEPLSNLDAALRVGMRVEIAKLKAELNATMIYVTHDQVEAMTLADKIVVLRDGVIEQIGAPLDLYHYPRNLFVAGFIGSPKMNFLPVQTTGSDATGIDVTLPGGGTLRVAMRGGAPKGKLTLGVRPEHLTIEPATGAAISGEVMVVEHLGGETYLYVRVGEDTVVVKAEGDSTVGRGQTVRLGIPPELSHLFDESGLALAARQAEPVAA